MTITWSPTLTALRAAAAAARDSDNAPALAIADALEREGDRYDAAVAAGLWIDTSAAFSALCADIGVATTPPGGWEAAHPGETWQNATSQRAHDLAVSVVRTEGLARAALHLASVLASIGTLSAAFALPTAPPATATLTAVRAESLRHTVEAYALAAMRAADHGRDAFSGLGRDLTEPEQRALALSRDRVRDRWAALRDGTLYPGESSDATLQRALDAAVAELAFLTTEAP